MDEVKTSQISGRVILVTGASGFIGAHLCRRLVQAGATVHGIARNAQPSSLSGPRWWQCDASVSDQLRKCFAEVRPELVFHLASHVSGSRDRAAVQPTFRDNLVSTVNLLMLASEVGCHRIVLAGSLEEPLPGPEEAIPASPYAAAKGAAGSYARMFHALYQTPVVMGRLFMVYGPGQRDPHKLIPYVTRCLLRDEIPAVTSGTRPVDWIYVEDVVEGLIAVAQAPRVEGATVDLGSGTMVTVREVVERLVQIVGSNIKPAFGELADRPLERVRQADLIQTEKLIDWHPRTSLDDGLKSTVAWYKEQARAGLF